MKKKIVATISRTFDQCTTNSHTAEVQAHSITKIHNNFYEKTNFKKDFLYRKYFNSKHIYLSSLFAASRWEKNKSFP